MTWTYTRSVADPTNDERSVREANVMVTFTWEGGAYIDVSAGLSRQAKEVINVWNDSKDEPWIPRTQVAFEARCNEWVADYGGGDLIHDIIHNWTFY